MAPITGISSNLLGNIRSKLGNATATKSQQLGKKIEQVQKEVESIEVNQNKINESKKELGIASRVVSKMRLVGDGKRVANSKDPYEEFTNLINSVNDFMALASESQNSLERISKKIDKTNSVSVELALDNQIASKIGVSYSYLDKEIVVLDEAKTEEAITARAAARANDYKLYDFFKSVVGGKDLLVIDNAAAFVAAIDGKYNSLTPTPQAEFAVSLNELLVGVGLVYTPPQQPQPQQGTVTKVAGGAALDGATLTKIQENVKASIELFDTYLPKIRSELIRIKSNLARGIKAFDNKIELETEKYDKELIEKQKKISEYEKKEVNIEQEKEKLRIMDEIFQKEMEQLEKFFDNMLRNLGLEGKDN